MKDILEEYEAVKIAKIPSRTFNHEYAKQVAEKFLSRLGIKDQKTFDMLAGELETDLNQNLKHS